LLVELHDIVFFDEGHFDIELGELGLAISAEVFVAEAADDLVVAIETGDHEELFPLLGRLWERIEAAGVHTGGDEIVTRALGGGEAKHGGFDIDEAMGVVEVADVLGDAMAEAEVAGHAFTAKVQVTEAEAGGIADVDVGVDGERRSLRGVEDGDGGGLELDVAGGEFWVLGAIPTSDDLAPDLDDVFVADAGGGGGGLRGVFGVEDDLDDAGGVAEVDEDEATVITASVDPAGEGDLPAGVLGSEFAALVGLQHGVASLLRGFGTRSSVARGRGGF